MVKQTNESAEITAGEYAGPVRRRGPGRFRSSEIFFSRSTQSSSKDGFHRKHGKNIGCEGIWNESYLYAVDDFFLGNRFDGDAGFPQTVSIAEFDQGPQRLPWLMRRAVTPLDLPGSHGLFGAGVK